MTIITYWAPIQTQLICSAIDVTHQYFLVIEFYCIAEKCQVTLDAERVSITMNSRKIKKAFDVWSIKKMQPSPASLHS